MSIQAVSFGKQAVTKKGNQYEKTNIGGKVGVAVGTGYAAWTGARTVKALASINANSLVKLYKATLKALPEGAEKSFPKYKEFATNAIKAIKTATVPAIIIYSGLAILAGFGVGKIVDAITNKIRAKKADSQNA